MRPTSEHVEHVLVEVDRLVVGEAAEEAESLESQAEEGGLGGRLEHWPETGVAKGNDESDQRDDRSTDESAEQVRQRDECLEYGVQGLSHRGVEEEELPRGARVTSTACDGQLGSG